MTKFYKNVLKTVQLMKSEGKTEQEIRAEFTQANPEDLEKALERVFTPVSRQEQIEVALRAAADRADVPASTKQVRFLASLMDKAGKTADDYGMAITNRTAVLSKQRASALIGELV